MRGNTWVFDHPFFMILNLAVGGSLAGQPRRQHPVPQTMLIDYVRVSAWQPDGGGGTGGNLAVGD